MVPRHNRSSVFGGLLLVLLNISIGYCHVVKVNMNVFLDRRLEDFTEVHAPPEIHLSDEEVIGAVKLVNLTLGGVRSMTRSGDAHFWLTEGNNFNNEEKFTFGNLTLEVGRMEEGGQEGAATLLIGKNEVSLEYKVNIREDGCSKSVIRLELTNLDDVTIKSDNPAFDGRKVTQDFLYGLKLFFNRKLDSPETRDFVLAWSPMRCDQDE